MDIDPTDAARAPGWGLELPTHDDERRTPWFASTTRSDATSHVTCPRLPFA